MPATFEVTGQKATRFDTFWLDPQDIHIDAENNGRHDLPPVEWLIDSIEKNGQTTPCVIRKDGQKALMVEGHTRWRAIVAINKTRKPADRLRVWCSLFRGNEIDALMVGFAANRERNALTPVDEGYFVHRLMKYGKKLDEIAGIVHETAAWCNQRLALVSLTPEVQQAVTDGAIKPGAAVALSKLSSDLQRQAVKERTAKGKVDPVAVRAATGKKAPIPMKSLRVELDLLATGAKEFDGTPAQLAQWVLLVLNGKTPVREDAAA